MDEQINQTKTKPNQTKPNLSCQLQDINKEKVCVPCNAIMFMWTFMLLGHMAQQLKDKANSTMIPLSYSVY
jgi:hypothetical protein